MIWYSPDFYAWLKANRPNQEAQCPAVASPVPDGAMIIKEMYPAPAAACGSVDPINLIPNKHGAAIMVRDSKVAHDGWFWGWFGWPGSGWAPDWPAPNTSPMQNMGFGQYCTNCHASRGQQPDLRRAQEHQGRSRAADGISQPGFLPGSDLAKSPPQSAAVGQTGLSATEAGGKPEFPARQITGAAVARHSADPRPAGRNATDNLRQRLGQARAGPTAASQFVTSDQCLGCHDAGSTGLQFDMTQPGTDTQLVNNSPYGTWRGSPMGLAGRDPNLLRATRQRNRDVP